MCANKELQRSGRDFRRTLLLAIFLLGPRVLLAQTSGTINYPTFSSVAGLVLNGSATQVGSALQLTPLAGGVGTAWFNSPVSVGNGFDTTFTYNIFGGSGADGLTFTIQSSGVAALGGGGSDIGVGGIVNAVSVSFRTFVSNVIEIDSCGIGAAHSVGGCQLAVAGGAIRGQHTVRVVYVPGTMTVSFDGTQVLSVPLVLPNRMSLSNGQAFVGFTASTGAATDIQQILSWQFSNSTSVCSTDNRAPTSGSSGAQGVLDSASWPAGAIVSHLNMDTGVMSFFASSGQSVGTPVTLPGARTTAAPAFPNGLNFASLHLGPGTTLAFTTAATALPAPVMVLSCQDVVLDAGSTLTVSPLIGTGPAPAAFVGGTGLNSTVAPAGFGPRAGPLPAAASLYPAIGGSGGRGGPGTTDIAGPSGGGGGPAFIIAAAQRITVNGTIAAMGLSATQTGLPGAQGGAGGSVRLAALLVEGTGTILTNAGADSNGQVLNPSGPVEIQAFLQDLFSGTALDPIRGNAPVQPNPTNLPAIHIDQINAPDALCVSAPCANSGSLSSPDVTLLPSSNNQVPVTFTISTQNVPANTSLELRAVGTDGSFAATTIQLPATTATLTLSAGARHQITVVPVSTFPLARDIAGLTTMAGSAGPLTTVHTPALAGQWMKMFGVVPVEAANHSKDAHPESD